MPPSGLGHSKSVSPLAIPFPSAVSYLKTFLVGRLCTPVPLELLVRFKSFPSIFNPHQFTHFFKFRLLFCCLVLFVSTDLRKRPGFWIENLSENYGDVGLLLSIHFTASGDVRLEVNGQDQGVVLTDVDTRTPLWFMVDVYGNTTAVQFVGKSNCFASPFLKIHFDNLKIIIQILEAV